ncbi:hypothetical protein HUL33_003841 [Salmonella enterica]|nr:hypothetical protein [Salmonella enterica]
MLPKNSKTARILKEPHAAMGGNSGNYVRAEVEFDSTKRKLLPIKGYRPDIVIPSLTDEYWGITFVEGEIELFDFPFIVSLAFTFNDEHYLQIRENQLFVIMEGPHLVGKGRFLEIHFIPKNVNT